MAHAPSEGKPVDGFESDGRINPGESAEEPIKPGWASLKFREDPGLHEAIKWVILR
jgi:hypothetical protein